MSDLCWTCQQNNSSILKTVNRPANEKTMVSSDTEMKILHKHVSYSQAITAAENHLTAVALERTFYRDISKKNHTNLKAYYTVEDKFQPPPFGTISRPMLLPTTVHYSFDMAQQVCV